MCGDMGEESRSEPSREHLLRAAQALGSPTRVAIVDALRVAGMRPTSRSRGLTRAQLRRVVPDAAPALSHHLKMLGEGGWITTSGEGSKRVYEAVAQPVSWSPERLEGDPELQLAHRTVERMMHMRRRSRADLWLSERDAGDWPEDWRDAESSRDFQLQLTPAQLEELDRRLVEVVESFKEVPPEADTSWVMFQLHGFPFRVSV